MISMVSFSIFFFMTIALTVCLSAVPLLRIHVLESVAWMTGLLTFLLDF